MNVIMRAKVRVNQVLDHGSGTTTPPAAQTIKAAPVSDKSFDADGNSEDNSFARWTPCGSVELMINNPNLIGKIKEGDKFYIDFIPAEA